VMTTSSEFNPGERRRYYEYRTGKTLPHRREAPTNCMFHDDGTASMSINLKDGTWFCHARNLGGGIFAFERKLTGKPAAECWESINGIIGRATLNGHQPNHQPQAQQSHARIVATYDYTDKFKKLIHQTVRYIPKRFKQRRPDGKGGWLWSLTGVIPVLYDLPGVLRANVIGITEGEKDKHNFDKAAASFPTDDGKLVYCGTTNAMGAGKWRDEYSQCLQGKIAVYVFEDNDDAGRKRTRQICSSVAKYLDVIYIVRFPELPKGGDVTDFLQDHTPAELWERMQAAPKWEPTANGTDEDAREPKLSRTELPRFEAGASGIFYRGIDREGNPKEPLWLSAPLDVVAQTRNGESLAWGRLLRWFDNKGVLHSWAMPYELLHTDGTAVRSELGRCGLTMATGRAAHDLLLSYIQAWPVDEFMRCVDRLGWQGEVYITPSATIGENTEQVVFQNAHAIEPAFSASGTKEQWRDHVAALARGNTRMIFAICAALSGPLLGPAGAETGGFHFRGPSSTGKTTTMKLGASVWGDPLHYCRSWRTTINGLEALAALHNDGILILDELAQVNPHEAGECAYMLANGVGKTRASRDGTARPAAEWRLVFLSAGEQSLAAMMGQVDRKTTAGQEIRLAEIDIDAGANMGGLESLHDYSSASALIAALKDGTSRYYGSVGVAWLHWLVAQLSAPADSAGTDLASRISDSVQQFVKDHAANDTTGQVERVARRFALVAAAGELATQAGLTGWDAGEAEKAVAKCFASWVDIFGGGTTTREVRNLLAQVKTFFELHGNSRFENMDAMEQQRIQQRAGFYRLRLDPQRSESLDDWCRDYYVLPQVFRAEVCKGHDFRDAIKILRTHGWLIPGSDGRHQQKPRLPEIGTTWVYVIGGKMWEHEQ
jgi:uncharacterized protein (DUF927 family)